MTHIEELHYCDKVLNKENHCSKKSQPSEDTKCVESKADQKRDYDSMKAASPLRTPLFLGKT